MPEATYPAFTAAHAQPVFYFVADMARPSSPLRVVTEQTDVTGAPLVQQTPHSVAEAGQEPLSAARLVARYLASKTGEDHGADDPTLHVERMVFEVQRRVNGGEYEPINPVAAAFDTQDMAETVLIIEREDDERSDYRLIVRHRLAVGSLEVLEEDEGNGEQVHYLVNGTTYATLADILRTNHDDQELCEWARTAQPGDTFGGGAGGSVECFAGPVPPTTHYEVYNTATRVSFGAFEAASPEAAIEACVKDAGYKSVADLEEELQAHVKLAASPSIAPRVE